MKKTNKTLLIALVSVILVAVIVLCAALFFGGSKKKDEGWSFEDDTLIITCDSMESWQDEIPWEDLKPEIKEVDIEDNVQDICKNAFSDCTELEKVSIGKSVKSIGKAAFKNCTKLKEITIPASVKEVKRYAFSGCRDLIIKVENEEAVQNFEANWCEEDAVITPVNAPEKTEILVDEESEPITTQTETTELSTTTTTAPPTTTTTEKPTGTFTFSSTTLDGGTLSYSDLTDCDLIMINTWEPWCGACVSQMPDLERLYENYKNQGFTIVGVTSYGTAEDARSVISSTGTSYPQVFSGDYHFAPLNTGYVPSVIFVDGDGNILTTSAYIGSRTYSDWESIILSYLG